MSTSITRASPRPSPCAARAAASPPRFIPRTGRRAGASSKALQCSLARIRDLEERIELGELEERLQVVVQIGESQLTALLPDLLREGHEHAETRAVDISRLREVDEELLLAPLQLVQHLLLQFLSVANDELALYIHHNDVCLLRDREAHEVFS